MIGLDRFDFGKSLAKQIEAYKRLSLQAQKRREPNLVKFLDAYTKKYMAVINNPGAANPGLLKNDLAKPDFIRVFFAFPGHLP